MTMVRKFLGYIWDLAAIGAALLFRGHGHDQVLLAILVPGLFIFGDVERRWELRKPPIRRR